MNIRIVWVGKTRNAPIRSLLADYTSRLRRVVSVEIIEISDLSKRRGLRGAALVAAEGAEIAKQLSGDVRKVVLDERGKTLDSVGFAHWIEAEQLRGTREIAFVIGGSEGIDRGVARSADLELSLGKMTWTHEIARLLLLEQIYRAYSILHNSPYHK